MVSKKGEGVVFGEIADGMAKTTASKKDDVMFLGEIVGHDLALHDRAFHVAKGLLEHSFITAVADDSVELQVSGLLERIEVDRAQVRRSRRGHRGTGGSRSGAQQARRSTGIASSGDVATHPCLFSS